MWLDHLKELKKTKGMTLTQIADATKIPESTIKRIFSGDTTDPYVTTIHRIVVALGGSLDHILADTNAVISTESLVEVKEIADVVEAERDIVASRNEMLEAKVTALTMELELLKKELAHKEELLALHNYYKTHIEQLIKKEGII
jgi:transcriptional regulator with XRE-family HTH domain